MTASPRKPRDERPLLSDAIRAAAQSGSPESCPSIESIHGAVAGQLSEADRRTVLSHAARCGACAAEVKLAEAFERPMTAAEEHDVDRVLASIRKPVPTLRTGASPVGMRRIVAWTAAAAAILLLSVTVGPRLFDDRPEIGPPSNVPRGETITLESPLATIPAGDTTFRWTAVSGARSYELLVQAADGSEVLRRQATENHVEVRAAEEDGSLRPGSVYFWEVRALGSEGADLGSSGKGTFTIQSDVPRPR